VLLLRLESAHTAVAAERWIRARIISLFYFLFHRETDVIGADDKRKLARGKRMRLPTLSTSQTIDWLRKSAI